MIYKNYFLTTAMLLTVAGFSQSSPSATLYFGLNGGVIQTGEFAGGSSVNYKSKKNTIFSIGMFDINASKTRGLSSKDGSDIHYAFVGLYMNIGKIIPLKNDKFFLNIQAGPSITKKFEVAPNGFSWSFDFDGISNTPARPIPPPTKKKSKFGLYSSASINYQLLKFMRAEVGINSNISP